MTGSSDIQGFYKLSMEKRRDVLKRFASLSEEEMRALASTGGLPADVADHMIENVVGGYTYPLGMATNFRINGRDYIVPMALEEPSVVAAASNADKMARVKGGFKVTNTGPVMTGQIQVVNVPNPEGAKKKLLASKADLLKKANDQDPMLVSLGGGAKDLNVKVLSTLKGPMVIAELVVNTWDAMGANSVNTMAEAVAPVVEVLTGGKVFLRIISNLSDRRLVRATVVFEKEAVGGEDVVDGIVYAYAFADADPYRCATHNKGIMNGVIAVGIACGQDIRALEAGAHSYSSRSGKHKPLTTWEKNRDGYLVGTRLSAIVRSLQAGTPLLAARAAALVQWYDDGGADIKILGVKTAIELAEVMGAVGLAQNFAALRALASEGIQRGHMKLHAFNVASAAGATGDMIEQVAKRMIEERKIRADRAVELVKELKTSKK
jgi:hydroxymethylglutaryl-CoA reductase